MQDRLCEVQMTIDEVRFGEVDLSTCDREPIHIPGSSSRTAFCWWCGVRISPLFNMRETAQRRATHQKMHAALARTLPLAHDIASELVSGKVRPLELIPAGGVAIWLGGELHTLGQTPPNEIIAAVVLWRRAVRPTM